MHYLIQKTTLQHIAVADDMPCPVECVKVRADEDGWVVYHDVVCPVPINSRVDVVGKVGLPLYAREASGIWWDRVAEYRPECDTIMARAGETMPAHEIARHFGVTIPNHTDGLDHVPRYQADAAHGHETAAMLLSIICAFALGALIGWGWM